jgi:hypothetical protein
MSSVETITCAKCGTIWEVFPCDVCRKRASEQPLPHSYVQHGTCLECGNQDLLADRDRVSRGKMKRKGWEGPGIP